MEPKSVWESYSDKQLKDMHTFNDAYRVFLSESKTERECVDNIVNDIEKAGYVELQKVIASGRKLKKGDKVYAVNMNKNVVMFQIGSEPLEKGMNILGAHIDSPRLDLKQNPLYEEKGLALLDTHYYGGIKKYQWVTLPLALHGVIVKKDGTVAEISLGEEEDDPVFFISDILIHLAGDQMSKTAAKAVEGEALNIICGNKPIKMDSPIKMDKASKTKTAAAAKTSAKQTAVKKDAKDEAEEKAKEGVKAGVLAILKDLYGVEEEDFLSAEIEVVPAGKAREAGFDRSMIMSYGQDDRVCAYGSYKAMLAVKSVKRTACCILVDKEEIGSVGATGMQSRFFENIVAEVMNLTGSYSELLLRRCLANSLMLSSDVSAGFDPNYASCFEPKNSCYLGSGMVINKYTGSRGKYSSNDASAEYMAYIRKVLDEGNVIFQTAELGKVDQGGGGTIAYILAQYGMNVIDSGVAVLDMHAPWEVTSKADVYETYRGYIAFLNGEGM
ncbi:MAG: aminopeptidase [Lachnospiraceae bacterium]|nr:aminopeptidase [Lachnospiraceae bacterium]